MLQQRKISSVTEAQQVKRVKQLTVNSSLWSDFLDISPGLICIGLMIIIAAICT